MKFKISDLTRLILTGMLLYFVYQDTQSLWLCLVLGFLTVANELNVITIRLLSRRLQ